MELKFTTARKVRKAHDEVMEFIYYVDSFYNMHSGIIPIADRETIKEAISIYLYLAKTENIDVEFDSIDREEVRAIIEEIYPLSTID